MVAEEHGAGWLDSLRNPESPIMGAQPSDAGEMLPGGREGYRRAHEELLTLQGVGPKVADCVCLMGLGWGEAVPVDTHGMTSHSASGIDLLPFLLMTPIKFGKSLSATTNSAKGSTAV